MNIDIQRDNLILDNHTIWTNDNSWVKRMRLSISNVVDDQYDITYNKDDDEHIVYISDSIEIKRNKYYFLNTNEAVLYSNTMAGPTIPRSSYRRVLTNFNLRLSPHSLP